MLEQLNQRIAFEKGVEGRQVTPTWFVHHYVARVLAQRLQAAQHAIIERFAGRTINEVSLGNSCSGLEAGCHGGLFSTGNDRQSYPPGTHRGCPPSPATVEERGAQRLNWPSHPQSPPLDDDLRRHVLGYIADCLPNLPAGPHDRRQPDLYGQAYVFVFNATFDAILDGDHDRAATWFMTLFNQGQAAGRRMIADVAGQLPLLQFIYTVEPMVALMELSGYAILLQELDGEGDSGTPIRPMWDSRRDQLGEDFLPNLLDIMSDVDSAISLDRRPLRPAQ